ncbi:hypothetical protein [Streptomyces sp. NPDC017890]|uniref:hypothetical protein n=1 Tax=Streptomyces sp. NPDC017890 TaxID=3365015 RepID=UPI003794549E
MAAADMEWWSSLGPVRERLNDVLSQIAATVRTHFGGQVTYTSAPWEFVDWGAFDLAGIDAYRAACNAGSFRDELRGHLAHGKPVAVTEYEPVRTRARENVAAWPGRCRTARSRTKTSRHATSPICWTSSRTKAWTERSGSPSPTAAGPGSKTLAPAASS